MKRASLAVIVIGILLWSAGLQAQTAPALPDLKVTRVWVAGPNQVQYTPLSFNPVPGQQINLVCEFENAGAAVNSPFLVDYLVDGVKIYTQTFGGIPAGAKRNPAKSYLVALAPGSHKFECVLDAGNTIKELNDQNNRASIAFQVAQQQVKPPFTVSYAPQQFNIEMLFENPSGKSWWTGNNLATITVSRQDNSPSCNQYNSVCLLSLGQNYCVHLPNTCSLSVEFKNIPVFNEASVRNVCGGAINAGVTNANATLRQVLEVTARYWKPNAGEAWEDVAVVPIAANLRCERELKPHK